MRRSIVQIDETKCDGCGQCVSACAEGAIQIVAGKAKLVADVYCDGLGACLGKCPREAITIVEREAIAFDAATVHDRAVHAPIPPRKAVCTPTAPHVCPGMAVQDFCLRVLPPATGVMPDAPPPASSASVAALCHWPVQLHLVPPTASFLANAELFLVADCVPFACRDFHERILRRRPVVIGCPKLDDGQAYVRKLADILQHNELQSLTVVHMEVPCCTQLLQIAAEAIRISGVIVTLEEIVISRQGEILSNLPAAGCASATR